MVIKFLCPNGHQLSAPETLAGKAGKCPKCATPFVVPAAENGEVSAEPSSSVTSGSATAAGISTGSGKSGLKSGEVFVFLCPNGHKLNGPPSLKGKAGQCPHCGARFRIPSDEDFEEDEAAADERTAGDSGSASPFANLFGAHAEEELTENAVEPEMVDEVEEPDPEPIPSGVHALGYIVGRLWDRRDDDTELEIYLTEGEIMSPDYYAELLSSDQYGVFANLEGDGTYAVTVIPWSAVRRVGMRKIENLSPKLFR